MAKWTEEQRQKFSATMKAHYAKKKAEAAVAKFNKDERVDVPKRKYKKRQEKGVRSNGSITKSKKATPQAVPNSRLEVATAYLWGHAELFIHSIASQYGLTFDELAKGLEAVIRSKTLRS